MAAVLGTLYAGGAYLLLDPDLPPDRQATLLRQARAKAIVADGQALKLDSNAPAIDFTAISPGPRFQPADVQAGQPAYVVAEAAGDEVGDDDRVRPFADLKRMLEKG